MLLLVIQDMLFLPVLQPEISGDFSVVFVDFSIMVAPSVKLAFTDAQPGDEQLEGKPGFLRPVIDKIDDGIAGVGKNPAIR